MDLSIIIVNWNSKDYLRKCIDSIMANTPGIEYEIIVIDSASFDGCAEMLRELYPKVRFIQSDRNLGFAMANNEGFKFSTGRNLLFINPDTETKSGAIEKMLRHLEALPDAGIVGARLLNTDRSVQTSCIRAFPSILNEVLDAEGLRNFFPRSRLWGMAALFDKTCVPREVDAVSGACLIVKRPIFEKVGRFSADYFMYSEDIDLCFKVRQAGWKAYFIPDSIVIHHGGVSSSKTKVNTFSDVMMMESRRRFFRKTKNRCYSESFKVAILAASVVRVAALVLIWPVFRMWGKPSSIEVALRKWTARLRWALGFEKRVSNY